MAAGLVDSKSEGCSAGVLAHFRYSFGPEFGHNPDMFDDPIAYFITWTCYGTYLPGDHRGWTRWHKGDQLPIPSLEDWMPMERGIE